MANITITETTELIKVEFNDLSSLLGFSKGTWRKDKINSVLKFSTFLEVKINQNSEWRVSTTGDDNSMIIDTINGVSVLDLDDLYTKLLGVIE